MNEDSELLEYETEQPDAGEMTPIPVYVCEPVTTVPTVPQHTTAYTVILTSGDEVAQLLPQDALRTRATVLLKGSKDVVICHTVSQAQDARNRAATLASPSGAILPNGTGPLVITSTQELWVTGDASGGDILIGVLVERRSP